MKVQNKAYILNLANKILNANKSRRNVLFLAIILTSILFTSLFSVGLGLAKSMEFQTMKSIGSISHGSFKQLSSKDIEILSKDKDVKEYSIRRFIGILDNNQVTAELSYMDEKGFEWALLDNIEGRMPEKVNEVFIDKTTATKLGYKGEIGERIEIPFNIEMAYTGEILEKRTADFIISGTFEPPVDSNVGIGLIYVSKAYAESLPTTDRTSEMGVMLNNSINIENKLRKIAHRNGYEIVNNPRGLSDNELRVGVNFAYLLSGGESFDYKVFLPGLILMIVVILAGFLIINNIFKISISEDIKLIGSLKTLGMTSVQIKQLVHFQSMIVALPSVIIGNIIGIGVGNIILNKIFTTNAVLATIELSVVSTILIVLFSIIFTLFTAFLSVMRPAKYASKISAIEASKHNENRVKGPYKIESISLGKLARREVFSNKVRFISLVLSMSLSAVILNSALTYTGNIDIEKGLSDIIVSDYNVASPQYFRYMYQKENGLSYQAIEEIENQEGFKGGGAIYSEGIESFYPFISVDNKSISPVVFGIDEYLIPKQNIIQGDFDLEKWKSGSYIIIGEVEENSSFYNVGDKLKIKTENMEKEVEVMAKIDYNFSNGLRYSLVVHENVNDEASPVLGLEYIYLPTSAYEELIDEKSIMSYGFDIDTSQKEKFDNLLKDLERNPNFAYDSRTQQIKSFLDYKNLIEFVGYSLSAVLFLISVLNFINIIATETLKNIVNLSILEAIGMTKKKIKSYLVKKNLIYSFSSLVFSFIIMLLVNEFILKDLMAQTRWTSFNFTIFPLIIVNLANIIIGILFTRKFYDNHSRNSLVDRIRNLE